jgi:hypothetical protein
LVVVAALEMQLLLLLAVLVAVDHHKEMLLLAQPGKVTEEEHAMGQLEQVLAAAVGLAL